MYFKRLGITVKFIDNDDLQAFEAAIDDKTKALYVESIGNPKYNVAPIPELASVSGKAMSLFGFEVSHQNANELLGFIVSIV